MIAVVTMDPRFPAPSFAGEEPTGSPRPAATSPPSSQNNSSEDGPICGICNADPQTKYLNYGAHSCFSCRAFFRRALQKTRAPTFTCQRGGTCELNAETRRRCQKCRYDGCIKAGMAPELVLNPEQRLERFQAKVAKSVASASEQHGGEATSDGGVDEATARQASPPKRLRPDGTEKRKYVRRKKPSAAVNQDEVIPSQSQIAQRDDFSLERSMLRIHGMDGDSNASNNMIPLVIEASSTSVSHIGESTTNEATLLDSLPSPSHALNKIKNESTKPGGKFKTKMMMMYAQEEQEEQMKVVQMAENGSLSQLEISHDVYSVPPPDKKIDLRLLLHKTMSSNITWKTAMKKYVDQVKLSVDTFVNYHTGCDLEWMDKQFFRGHLALIKDFLASYSEKYPDFALLSDRDKNILLRQNSSMLVAFFLAKYWGSISTKEQLQWILLNNNVPGDSLSSMPPGTFNNFIQTLGFSFCDHHISHINSLIWKVVQQEGGGPIEWPAVHAIAHGCLFHVDSFNFSLLDSPELIQRISWESSLILYQKNTNHADLHELKTNLRELSVLLMQNVNFCPETFSLSPQDHLPSLVLPPSEDPWLSSEIARVDQCFLSVSYGEEVISDFVAVSSGEKPFSRQFLGNVCSVYAERSRSLLKQFPEFNDLSDKDQMALWMASIVPVFSCVISNVEAGDTLMEQAIFMATQEDRRLVVAKIRDIPRERLRPVKLRDFSSENSTVVSFGVQQELIRCMGNLSVLTRDRVALYCFILYTLFKSGEEMFGGGPVAELCQRYLFAIHRRRNENAELTSEAVALVAESIRKLSLLIRQILLGGEGSLGS